MLILSFLSPLLPTSEHMPLLVETAAILALWDPPRMRICLWEGRGESQKSPASSVTSSGYCFPHLPTCLVHGKKKKFHEQRLCLYLFFYSILFINVIIFTSLHKFIPKYVTVFYAIIINYKSTSCIILLYWIFFCGQNNKEVYFIKCLYF